MINLNILVVDDQPEPIESLDAGFELHLMHPRFAKVFTYDLTMATNEVEAKNCIDQRSVHVAIIDQSLTDGKKGLDTLGLEVLKHLRLKHEYAEGIILTANPRAEARKQALRDGAFDYVSKSDDSKFNDLAKYGWQEVMVRVSFHAMKIVAARMSYLDSANFSSDDVNCFLNCRF